MSFEEHYDSESVSEYELQEDLFYETEEMITKDMKKIEQATYYIHDEIVGSNNPFLLKYMDSTDLFNFLYEEKFSNKQVKQQPELILPEPTTNYDYKPISKGNWVVIRSRKEQEEYDREQQEYLEANKEKIEKEKQKKMEEQKQKELQVKAKANKYNWTLPAELRGIVKQEKPKLSKSQKRRNRRKAFKVNKNNPTQQHQEKKKSGFRVNRSNPMKL